MIPRYLLHFPFVVAVVCLGSAFCDAGERGDEIDFNRDVRPILAANCFACHGFDAAAREAELRLDTHQDAVESGAIVPGDPAASELVGRIQAQDDSRMPPEDSAKRLTPAQVQILVKWIEQGAEYETHWAFVPPQRPAPPAIPTAEHPIDRFIQFRLSQHALVPADRAAPETLIRRVSLDLTGLPPTLDQVDDFVSAFTLDPDTAYRELVDQLLRSPHYGERWARWWLDQARYADSNGYSIDAPREIWKYRDWVVAALNDDMPFDQFTIQQLAGDLLPAATESQQVATGFHRNTQINQEGGIDKEQFRVDSVFDRVATTGTVWLGLSIGCAQCHDHKFDPITQREYYRLFAFLNNQDEPSIKVYGDEIDRLREERQAAAAAIDDYLKPYQTERRLYEAWAVEPIQQQLSSDTSKALETEPDKRNMHQRRLVHRAVTAGSDADFERLYQQWNRLDKKINSAPSTMVLRERSQPRQSHLLVKGDFTRPAEPVKPGTPAVLHPLQCDSDNPNRLDLARWLVAPENPLTSRVIVNRIWQQYFGRGLSEVENDFGMQGSPPTHPHLLDWLAVEFVESGWSLKQMHRLIVTSHAYQQTSSVLSGNDRQDPNNYLLGRQARLRLDAEIIRDVALTASGLLSTKMGGRPVYPPIPDGVMNQGQVKRAWQTSQGEDRYRRGLYTFKFRATPPPSLNVFDSPDGFSTCTRRIRSNTPLQALTLMNDPAFFEFAAALAKIVELDGVETAFRRCTARHPSDAELTILRSLDHLGAARAMLNLDETITRE